MLPIADSPNQAWLYIAMDARHPQRTKLGVTLGDMYGRTGRQTANPGIVPLVHIAAPPEEAHKIERYLLRYCDYPAEPHATTGNDSEWFPCTPQQLANSIKHRLANSLEDSFSEDGDYNFSGSAVFPDLDYVRQLACHLHHGFKAYFIALNDVRREFGFPPITEQELFGV